jgi:hypothetical protein
MVIDMVKPIPMKESGPSRITIARAMWGRNYAYQATTLKCVWGSAALLICAVDVREHRLRFGIDLRF